MVHVQWTVLFDQPYRLISRGCLKAPLVYNRHKDRFMEFQIGKRVWSFRWQQGYKLSDYRC